LNDETKQKFKQTATSKAGKSEGFQGILFRRCKDKGGNIFDAFPKLDYQPPTLTTAES